MLVDDFEVVEDLLELAFAYLEHNVLVRLSASLLVATSKLQLRIQRRLLNPILSLATYLKIQSPIEIFQPICRSERILDVRLCQRSDVTHGLEKERLD